MSKKIQTLINEIEKDLDTLEDPDLDIEQAITLYSATLTKAATLSTSLKKAEQDIQVLSEKSDQILEMFQN